MKTTYSDTQLKRMSVERIQKLYIQGLVPTFQFGSVVMAKLYRK